MNEQNATPTADPMVSSSGKPPANFEAYGNLATSDPDGSNSLSHIPEPKATREGTQAFMTALQSTEKNGNASGLVAQFSSSCKLWRQSSLRSYEGPARAEDFWNEYLNQFQSIETHFTHVLERDDLAVLEWESEGALQGGRPIHYRGVSILEFGEEEKVETLKTYFDSAHFISVQPTSAGSHLS